MEMKRFFESVDWTTFYQEKMALIEVIDMLQKEAEDRRKQNAAYWLDGILNMMDAMGDVAEEHGLFEYPERDMDTDLCFDDRFNDVLDKTPADVSGKTADVEVKPTTTVNCWALVALTRIRQETMFTNQYFTDFFYMKVPAEKDIGDVEAYAESVLRQMVRFMLTGKNAVRYIRNTSFDYNWVDFISDLTTDVQDRFQCWFAHEQATLQPQLFASVQVNQDEVLFPDEELGCTVVIEQKEGQPIYVKASANMTSGAVALTSTAQFPRGKSLKLVFDDHEEDDIIQLYEWEEEAEQQGGHFFLDQPLCRMTFFNCLRLLHECVKAGLLQRSDKDESCILVYREAGTELPEGWYAENIHAVARELTNDEPALDYLLDELRKKGVEFKEEPFPEGNL